MPTHASSIHTKLVDLSDKVIINEILIGDVSIDFA